MPLYGKNNNAVNVTNVTVKETANGGGLIGAWTSVKGDQVNRTSGANAHFGNNSPGSRATVDLNLFGNSTPGAFIKGMAVGVFAVDSAVMATKNATGNGGITHTGWNIRKAWTGPIVSFSFSGISTGYNNTDVVTVSSNTAGGNASITLVTNATGGIISSVISNAGFGFTTKSPTVVIANSIGGATAGTGATFVATAGGRAGRVFYETMVAGSIIGNTILP